MKIAIPIAILFIFGAVGASATSIKKKDLPELVTETEHVILATIEKVDMIDSSGNEIKDPKARTMAEGYQIRLYLKVEEDGILSTTNDKKIERIVVPLWEMWHYSLEQWKAYETSSHIFLLKGKRYERVYPYYFIRNLSEKEEIMRLLQDAKAQNNKLKSDAKRSAS